MGDDIPADDADDAGETERALTAVLRAACARLRGLMREQQPIDLDNPPEQWSDADTLRAAKELLATANAVQEDDE
jgi:hypothetical protein